LWWALLWWVWRNLKLVDLKKKVGVENDEVSGFE
jgi:hypothetical protein